MSDLASNLTFRNLSFPNGTSTTNGQTCLGFSILNMSITSSVVAVCEIQYGNSESGTFTTFYKFGLSADVEKFNAVSVRGRYCRLRITNSTGGAGVITSNCILTQDAGGSNVHNTNIVKQDFNSILTREHSDLMADMINNEYEGYIIKDLNGIVSGVTNTSKRNFWNLDENGEVVLTNNTALYVVSDNNDDRSGFTGAHTVSIEYIFKDSDNNFQRGIQSAGVNGTTPQTLGVSGVAIVSATVISAGTNKANLGNLSFQAQIGVGPAVYQTLNYMPVGRNVTKLFVGVPIKNENLIIKEVNYGGTSQFIGKIRLSKVIISSGIRQVLLEEVVDGNNHYSKIDCSIQIQGQIQYIIGEFLATATPPAGSANHFHLTARGIFKSVENSV
tara:strand:- start:2478 stop:3638 length:1161 start_codon:yes stop_codon:yes gene_type:complete